MLNSKDDFLGPDFNTTIKHRCVAHLYALFITEQNDEECDATKAK